MTGLNLFWLIIGVFVAAGHLYAALFTWLTARPARTIDRLFSVLILFGAWYCLWSTLMHDGFGRQWPWIMGLMPLFPGYIGPGVFLLTLHITQPHRRPPWWAWVALAFGGFATAYGLRMLLNPEVAAEAAEALAHGHPPSDPIVYALWRIHTLQLAAFGLASLGLVSYRLWRPVSAAAHDLTRAWLGGVASALGAILVAGVIPAVTGQVAISRVGPLLTLPIVGVAWSAVRRTRRLADDLEVQQAKVRRYLPPTLRDALNRGAETLQGQLVERTVLMSDVREFTTLAERHPPIEVVEFLNRYLSTMAAVIGQHGGSVDKYVGDAILAVFEPGPNGDDAARALACAKAMEDALELVNAWWATRGEPPVRIGIGVHRGRMVLGNIGSPDMMQFTVVGDTVNTASRVEAATKDHGVTILATDAVVHALPAAARSAWASVGRTAVRGRRSDLGLWTDAVSAARMGRRPEAAPAPG